MRALTNTGSQYTTAYSNNGQTIALYALHLASESPPNIATALQNVQSSSNLRGNILIMSRPSTIDLHPQIFDKVSPINWLTVNKISKHDWLSLVGNA